MMNPDSVDRGNYKLDSNGHDLCNQFMESANSVLHPQVRAITKVMQRIPSESQQTYIHLFMEIKATLDTEGSYMVGKYHSYPNHMANQLLYP